MIYLLQSGNYYKIGFSDNFEQRIKCYLTHNPDVEVVDLREGTKADEDRLHELCKKYRYRTEWYFKDKEVLNIWNNYEPSKEVKHTEGKVSFESILHPKEPIYVFDDAAQELYTLKKSSFDILFWILKHIENNKGRMKFDKNIRREMCGDIDVSDIIAVKHLDLLKQTSLLRIIDDYIFINPFMFWKGDLDEREQIFNNKNILKIFNIEDEPIPNYHLTFFN